jgi:phosphatidylethanolamine-binding protein (PEBP) family uncharacterized protein
MPDHARRKATTPHRYVFTVLAVKVDLPETMRGRYAAHLIEITDRAPQLLISDDYD